MNVALLQRHHSRSSAEMFSELAESIGALPHAVDQIGQLIADRDRLAIERLERLTERLGGLQRLASLTRAALVNETRPPEVA